MRTSHSTVAGRDVVAPAPVRRARGPAITALLAAALAVASVTTLHPSSATDTPLTPVSVSRASLDDPATGPDEPLPPNSAGPPESAYSGDELATVQAHLTSVIESADRDWTTWFSTVGLQEPMVSYQFVEPGQTYQSNCTNIEGTGPLLVTADHPNAYYCDRDTLSDGYDGTLILPLVTMRKMWDGDIFSRQVKEPGDFAAATLVAHEFGHHVADELVRQGVFGGPPATPKNRELLADCYAGNWIAAVYQQGGFGDGASEYIGQAVTTLQAIGDYDISNPGHHGTPQERADAVQIGIYGTQADPRPATPEVCANQYWR